MVFPFFNPRTGHSIRLSNPPVITHRLGQDLGSMFNSKIEQLVRQRILRNSNALLMWRIR